MSSSSVVVRYAVLSVAAATLAPDLTSGSFQRLEITPLAPGAVIEPGYTFGLE